jgi:hypothetical protein
MTGTCGACRFFAATEGQCRRRAPLVTGGMMSSVETVFPVTLPTEWCGEYEAKAEDATESGCTLDKPGSRCECTVGDRRSCPHWKPAAPPSPPSGTGVCAMREQCHCLPLSEASRDACMNWIPF